MYQQPGVYLEEVPSSSRPIEAAGTSTALIVGYAVQGPIAEPVFITSFDQYTKQFGGINDFHRQTPSVDLMGHGVKAFFDNGGSKAYVVRLSGTTSATAEAVFPTFKLISAKPGVLANYLRVGYTALPAAPATTPPTTPTPPTLYNVRVFYLAADNTEQVWETYRGVSFIPTDGALFLGNQINDKSSLLRCEVITPTPTPIPSLSASPIAFAGGINPSFPTQADYENSALHTALRKFRDISIVYLPCIAWLGSEAAAKASIQAFQSHAEIMKNRMLIIDPDSKLKFVAAASFTDEGFPTSTYTCSYYPWVQVANPHYHPELRSDRKQVVDVPPSGYAAGLWARTDSRRGVWKAPAGLQASLLGISRPVVKIGDDEQDQLNPLGVNCLRNIISDTVIWGTRTLATKTDPEWRYIPVRRTAMMIEESIYQGIQWAVFEPNDHRLWGSLRLNIENFMMGLFRAGAFQGEKASDGFFVRCGLGDTMTQADIDVGQVIVLVGFAPVKPAEFVIVRLQQIVGKQ